LNAARFIIKHRGNSFNALKVSNINKTIKNIFYKKPIIKNNLFNAGSYYLVPYKMHEFAIASGIMETALSEAEKHKAKTVKKIVVEIGQLSMVGLEQVKFSLDILKEGTIAAKAEIEIVKTPVKLKCGQGHKTEKFLKEPLYASIRGVKCAKCKKKAEIVGGRECQIKEIEIDD
jgi:hydrogenase nickel incorporation protein HypA/HybF